MRATIALNKRRDFFILQDRTRELAGSFRRRSESCRRILTGRIVDSRWMDDVGRFKTESQKPAPDRSEPGLFATAGPVELANAAALAYGRGPGGRHARRLPA